MLYDRITMNLQVVLLIDDVLGTVDEDELNEVDVATKVSTHIQCLGYQDLLVDITVDVVEETVLDDERTAAT